MIKRLFDVRPDEYRNCAGGFITLFGIMAAHSLMEIARDAMFLATLPATKLPVIYMGIAVLSLAVVKLRQRQLLRFEWRNSLAVMLAWFAVMTLGLWFLTRGSVAGSAAGSTVWALYALYAWPAVFATVVITAFWTYMARLFTIAQAKRLFVVIGSGGILGAIAGTALSRLMVQSLPTAALLIAAVMILLAVAGVPRWFAARMEPGQPSLVSNAAAGLGSDLRVIGARPYVLRILLVITVTAATATVMDYLFKSRVAEAIPAQELPRFFSTFYLALNLVSLLVQLALVGRLVQVAGVVGAGITLPALLALSCGWFLAGGGFLAVLAGRSADGALRHSLNRTANELLYVPLPVDLRDRFKAVADVIGQRGGQAAASLVLVLFTTLGLGHTHLAVLVAMLALAWVVLAVDLRAHYLNVIRRVLDQPDSRHRVETHELDDAALHTLVARLESREVDEVLGALEVILESRRAASVPTALVDHPATPVKLKALTALALAPRAGMASHLTPLLPHEDAAVRLGAVQALVAARAGDTLSTPAFTDPDPAVKAAALVGLVAAGRLPAADAQARVEQMPEAGQVAVRLAAARAIRLAHRGGFSAWLAKLGATPDQAVALAAAKAMTRHPDRCQIPVLLTMLSEFRLRNAARRALVAIGPEALPQLERAMVDPDQPFEIRQHLPQTISRFEPAAAHAVLLRHLGQGFDSEIVFKVVRGLGTLRAENPHLPKPEAEVLAACERMVHQVYLSYRWRLALGTLPVPGSGVRTPVGEMLFDYLADHESRAREWLLRILGMFYAPTDLARIHTGIGKGDPAVVAAGLELLGEYLPPRLRRPVAGLMENLSPGERLKFAPASLPPVAPDCETLLGEMIDANDLHIRCLAAYHAGELGLQQFRPRLEQLATSRSSRLREVSVRSLQMLDDPRVERLTA